jgi:hypothetical protein
MRKTEQGGQDSDLSGAYSQTLRCWPAHVVCPAGFLQHPDNAGGGVELAGKDAVAGACGIGGMRVVPVLAEEPVDESDITVGEQVGGRNGPGWTTHAGTTSRYERTAILLLFQPNPETR